MIFNYLASSPLNDTNELSLKDRSHYIHLLNHTYEEIDGELSHLLINNNYNQTHRLFETKSAINSFFMILIETLFTSLIRNDIYFGELMGHHTQIFHQFYAHFIPFILQKFNCLFDISFDKILNSSFDILAMIFRIACCQQHEQECSLCVELLNDRNYKSNIRNCTLLFADEIQYARMHYINLERCLKNKNLSPKYSSTNTVKC